MSYLKTIIILCIILLMPSNLNARASYEQEKYINSLTLNQLYDLYIKQTIDILEAQHPEITSRYGYAKYREIAKRCARVALERNFSIQDMRILYIQPDEMDKIYYSKLIDKFSNEVTICITNSR